MPAPSGPGMGVLKTVLGSASEIWRLAAPRFRLAENILAMALREVSCPCPIAPGGMASACQKWTGGSSAKETAARRTIASTPHRQLAPAACRTAKRREPLSWMSATSSGRRSLRFTHHPADRPAAATSSDALLLPSSACLALVRRRPGHHPGTGRRCSQAPAESPRYLLLIGCLN